MIAPYSSPRRTFMLAILMKAFASANLSEVAMESVTASGEAAFFLEYAAGTPGARLGAGIGEMCCSRLAPIRFMLFHILDLLKRDPDGVASSGLS
jgi:hypothetical protein